MSTNKVKRVIGLSGSLRQNSYNTSLLRTAGELLPDGVEFTIADLSDIPNYNQDLEANPPAAVVHLIELAKSADAVVISTPEFNFSIPGVLKNALDWLSRPFAGTPLREKPVAITGATPGILGTVRAQMHLRDILYALDMRPITRPEVVVGQCHLKFDENGTLTDETTRDFLKQLMGKLHAAL